MQLQATYAKKAIHDQWESVYRTNPLQHKLNDQIMEYLVRQLDPPPGTRFLDAGCGVGDHLLRIAKRGYRCVGVDISETILHEAEKNLAAHGLETTASVVCQALEELAFEDEAFDVVHCRGVLMHIPQWERALAELCRVLKRGGKIVVLESNHNALEAWIVRLFRGLKKCDSKLVKTPAGLEFWSEKDGGPYVARLANINRLTDQLETCQVTVAKRLATEFWDINRFRAGLARNLAIRWNQLWFALRLPAFLSIGNGLIGQKRRG